MYKMNTVYSVVEECPINFTTQLHNTNIYRISGFCRSMNMMVFWDDKVKMGTGVSSLLA
jgi:hypothetical protein